MVKYSSVYSNNEKESNDVDMSEHKGGSSVGGSSVGGSFLYDHHKAKEVVLKMSNTDLHNLKEMAKLMEKLLPHIHKSDEEFGELLHLHSQGAGFFSAFGKGMKAMGHEYKREITKGAKWVGHKIKDEAEKTVDMITHPSPKNLLKLGLKAGLSASPLGMVGSTVAGVVGNKVIDKLPIGGSLRHLSGSLSDISKTKSHHHLVEMLEKDQKIMMENNEKLSHFLHALDMTKQITQA